MKCNTLRAAALLVTAIGIGWGAYAAEPVRAGAGTPGAPGSDEGTPGSDEGTPGTDEGTPGTDEGAPGAEESCGGGVLWGVHDINGGWDGVWVRRGATNTYDAVWHHTSGDEVVSAQLDVAIEGNTVTIQRTDMPNAYGVTNCTYEGTIEGLTVSGTVTCKGPAGSLGPFNWRAQIVCPTTPIETGATTPGQGTQQGTQHPQGGQGQQGGQHPQGMKPQQGVRHPRGMQYSQ
jgi:hypothetical protein